MIAFLRRLFPSLFPSLTKRYEKHVAATHALAIDADRRGEEIAAAIAALGAPAREAIAVKAAALKMLG